MKQNPKIIILDYGVGNLYNVTKAFKKFTQNCIITDNPSVLQTADAVVLPGVGAFEAGMKGLKARGLIEEVKKFASSGKPILGICLGAQLLLSQGNEFGTFDGLDIIKGKTVSFSDFKNIEKHVKIPHIGWNGIKIPNGTSWDNTILNSVLENSNMYFAHSYVLQPEEEKNILSLTDYDGIKFCSVVRKNNIYGCQFHPEKSREFGLKVIQNFVNLI